MTHVIDQAEWAENPGRWQGELPGANFGAGISLIFFSKDEIGAGPRLHRHPYPETFIIRSGQALFTIGDKQIEAHAGQILVVPPFTPHKFSNLGPGPLETIDIHASNAFATDWLE